MFLERVICLVVTICRGWDDLFNKCSENLNSLTAMKLSPYYKGTSLCHTLL